MTNEKSQFSTKFKMVAVLLAAALVFMQVPIAYGTGESTPDAEAENAAAVGTVDLGLDLQHAYINVSGQTVAAPASVITVPAWSDVEFTAAADTNYELAGVSVTSNGYNSVLTPNEAGVYTIPESVMDGTVTLSVTATEVAVESEIEAAEVVSAETAAEADAAEAEEADEAEPTKTEYSYEDSNVKVTAKLSAAGAVPDDAQFVVTPVTQDVTGYNYDAYMQALNDEAAAEIAAGDATEYTSENTLLYDVAFMVQNDEGKLVEYQPAEGSVKIAFEFKAAQLSDEIGANDEAGVEVKHLPLTASVKDAVDSTEEATSISASDIEVKDVAASTSVAAAESTFTVSDFSIFSFKNDEGQKNTWSGTRTFSYGDVVSALGETTNFAVYANRMKNSIHVEGNVKVGVLDIAGSEGLNQDGAVVQRNAIKSITVTKEAKDGITGTFNFAAYKAGSAEKGAELGTFEITIAEGETSNSYVLDSENAKAVLDATSTSNVVIAELDAAGNPVASGQTVDGKYTVTYKDNEIVSSANDSLYTNYIGAILNSGNCTLNPQYFYGSGVTATTYIESMDNVRFGGGSGRDLEFESTAEGKTTTVSIRDYSNIENDVNNLKLIQQQNGITETVSSTLNNMKALASQLATATNGAIAGRNSLSVINVVSTTGNLQGDLDSANFKSVVNGSGEGISNLLNEGGYLLVNIDVTGVDTYYLNKLVIDGVDPDGGNEELARHIIYNFITHSGEKDADGNYESYLPFTGTVTIDNLTGGTICAPAAKVLHNGGIRGAVIANEYDHTGGSELHYDSIARQTDAQVTVTNSLSGDDKGEWSAEAQLGFTKYFYGVGEQEFGFTLTASDENGEPRTTEGEFLGTDNGQAFTMSAKASGFGEDFSAPITFDPILYGEPGDYYYTVSEDKAEVDGVAMDETVYIVKVSIDADANVEISYKVKGEDGDFAPFDEAEKPAFYNNEIVTFSFMSFAMDTEVADEANKIVSVDPIAKKNLTDEEGVAINLTAGEFLFDLVDAETGAVIKSMGNSENGEIELGMLTYSEVGTYSYIVREQVGASPNITYDPTEFGVTVNVTEDENGALQAEVSYTNNTTGEAVDEVVFNNSFDGIDVRVQKVSRYGGEGLDECTYALWMVTPEGDVEIGQAASDASGYITFEDVDMIPGVKYYFKECIAPTGHTVDPYRTAYFTINDEGTELVLVEATADDGWHPAGYKDGE